METRWAGQLGSTKLGVDLLLLSQSLDTFSEPYEVLDLVGQSLADPAQGGVASFKFDEITHASGRYGWAGYAALGSSLEPDQGAACRVLRLAGLLEQAGYVLVLRATPEPSAAELKTLRAALIKAADSDATPRDARWTDAEAEARWKKSVPDDLAGELEDVLRTDHYVILTNSSGGKSFAKKMEECYAAIRKVYPFDDAKEERLMPVFLFRTNDQYYAFMGKAWEWDVEQATRTGGVAFGDLYATWYEAPGDPVHIHEATHQIFANRLYRSGGGSWFQEGTAEYMSTSHDDRDAAATAVENHKHVPLPELVTLKSLIFSNVKDEKNSDPTASTNQYLEAALLVEFLRESKFGKAKFPDYIRVVGATPRNDVRAIEAAIQQVYGVSLEGLEKEFVAYCKKR